MSHTLVIRGFDDDIHSQLGELAKQKGVSINSIVRDAVDKWINHHKEVPRRHHLLIYDNDEAMNDLLKSIDKMAKKGDWFRCYMRSTDSSVMNLLQKLNWYDSTATPNKHSSKDIKKYFNTCLHSNLQKSENKELCCMNFLIDEIAKSSIDEAINIEHAYEQNKLEGIVFCAYRIDNLLKTSISGMIEIFNLHEQIFMLRNEHIYKLYCTKENIHKLFLS